MEKGKFLYWGIDGCKSGWLCIGLQCNGESDAFVEPEISTAYKKMKDLGAQTILIDIPIGLSQDKNERECDKLARKEIGKKSSSVFRVPCRLAIEEYKKGSGEEQKVERGKIASVKITGGCLSQQTWAIVPKIAEVDDFMKNKTNNDVKLREVHPEVCFRKLNDDTLKYSKKIIEGKEERQKILVNYLPDIDVIKAKIRDKCQLKTQVADDDILDALVAAVTAKLGELGEFQTLPSGKPRKDCCGLPMEMVFVNKE